MISELWAQIQHEFNKFFINLVNFQIQNRKKSNMLRMSLIEKFPSSLISVISIDIHLSFSYFV